MIDSVRLAAEITSVPQNSTPRVADGIVQTSPRSRLTATLIGIPRSKKSPAMSDHGRADLIGCSMTGQPWATAAWAAASRAIGMRRGEQLT